jgi:hypothetical protein
MVETALVAALRSLYDSSPGDSLGQINGKGIENTETTYEKEKEMLGDQGLSEWTIDTAAVTAAVEAATPAQSESETPALPPPPPPVVLDPYQQQQQLQQQLLMADNMHGFPPKACPKDGIGMNYSDLAGGYNCPQHGLNPKPGFLQRIVGGTMELSTAAVATTGALAGASMGMMGAAMQAQGQMTQMGQMATNAPPPPPGASAQEVTVTCTTCNQPAQDMSAYGGAYAGKHYCNGCKVWVEPAVSPTVSPTLV